VGQKQRDERENRTEIDPLDRDCARI